MQSGTFYSDRYMKLQPTLFTCGCPLSVHHSTPLPPPPPCLQPCRSDKTKKGMVRYGHLCDGRLKLVLVSKCSPLQVGGWGGEQPCAAAGVYSAVAWSAVLDNMQSWPPPATTTELATCAPACLPPSLPPCPQYLRFLVHMSRPGCAPGAPKYLTVLDAVAVQVEPLGGAGQAAQGGDGHQQRTGGNISCWVRHTALLPLFSESNIALHCALFAALGHCRLPTAMTKQLISAIHPSVEPGWRAAAGAGPAHCGRGAPRSPASVLPRRGAVKRSQ